MGEWPCSLLRRASQYACSWPWNVDQAKVSLNDPSESNVNQVLEIAKKDGIRDQVEKFGNYEDLCKSLESPKVFFFTLPHGSVADTVIEGLREFLDKGDIILDASNENWGNTQRHQDDLVTHGVFYIGLGVSGGYQAARRGPSLCPGGEDRGFDIVMPLLETIAARGARGISCVARIGLGGSGHYVKMIHSGIEHGRGHGRS